MLERTELVDIILGNISNSLVNMKNDPSEESIQEEKFIIHEIIKNYIMYLQGKNVEIFNYEAETEDYDILNTLARIKILLLYIDAAYYIDIALYKKNIKEIYIKICDLIDEYIVSLNYKKTR